MLGIDKTLWLLILRSVLNMKEEARRERLPIALIQQLTEAALLERDNILRNRLCLWVHSMPHPIQVYGIDLPQHCAFVAFLFLLNIRLSYFLLYNLPRL